MHAGSVLFPAAAFAISLAGAGVLRRYALKHGIIDVPNPRSAHSTPTPRGGGAAIVLGFFAALALLMFCSQINPKAALALLLGGGATALIGFLDDRRPQSAALRFAVHLAAAVCVLLLVGGISETALESWGLRGAWIAGSFSVVSIVWTTNLFNFMDGIDGLAASESVFIGAAGAWINEAYGGDPGLTAGMACFAAASAGFLRWNWPPALMFMGDVGSGFIGFTLAALAVAASRASAVPIEVWAILGGVFVVDATVTLVRRAARGDRWFEAHRTHAYQNLARRWSSHRSVTLAALVVNLVWLFPWAILAARFPSKAPACLAAALIPLVGLALAGGAGAKEG